MDSFSLLKYWRGGGSGGSGSSGASTVRDSTKKTQHNNNITDSPSSTTTTTTIVTAVSPSSSSDSDDDNDDDGPFFDLEFTLPDDSDTEEQTKDEHSIAAIVEDFASENDFEEMSTLDEEEGQQNHNNYKEVVADVLSEDNEVMEGDEIKFTLSSSSSADSVDPNATLSPSDDLFFKGRLVPVESSSDSDAITKFPVSSILKSATKFRVLMLNFNKSRTNVREKYKKSPAPDSSSKEGQDKRQQSRFFTVKLKVEEVPIVSLFTRDNSSKGNTSAGKGSKKCNNDVEVSGSSSAPDDKKFSKDVMHKYLKKVKPLYIRVSKRYSEKLRFSGQLSFPKSGASSSSSPPPPHEAEVKSAPEKTADAKPGSQTSEVSEEVAVVNTKSQKQGNLHAGLRVVCKHLGKSRSASSAAMAVAPSAPLTSNRRDDSLLQQQDGIQGAILHCKRSFNAFRDLEGSILSRSASDPSHEKSANLTTEDSSSSSEDTNVQRKQESIKNHQP